MKTLPCGHACLNSLPPSEESLSRGYSTLMLALLIATSSCGGGSEYAKRINVLFPDRDGLQSGDPVRYQGFEIGEVASLEPAPGNVVRVALNIDQDHAENVREGAEFSIDEASDAEGEQTIVRLSMPKRDTPVLPDSATVVGQTDQWEQLLEVWKKKAEDMTEDAKEELAPWIERIQQEVRERTGQ